MGSVIPITSLDENELFTYAAMCPECEGTEWLLLVDGETVQEDNLYAFRCAACGFEVNATDCL